MTYGTRPLAIPILHFVFNLTAVLSDISLLFGDPSPSCLFCLLFVTYQSYVILHSCINNFFEENTSVDLSLLKKYVYSKHKCILEEIDLNLCS